MKNLLKKKKKEQLSEEEQIQQKREKTAQQWMPIANIDKAIVHRKDNVILGMLRVQPENLELLSDNERKKKIDALAEGFNGETESFQIFCIGRPVDLNSYLEWLQDMAKQEQNFIKKTVLKGYINQATQMASNGETTERRFYIIVTKPNGNKAETELINRLNDFKFKLSQAELTSKICTEDEIMDVYSLFANPVQASFEKTELLYDTSTMLEYQ